MGRKPRSSNADGNGRDGPAILECFLGRARPEVLEVSATPPPDEPAARSALPSIPTIIILDVSGSMLARGALAAVTQALPEFRQSILSDSLTARKLSFAVLTYADTPTLVRGYGPIADWTPPAELVTGFGTAMATAIIEAFRIQNKHVDKLAAQGRPIQHEFFFHFTDGEPTEPPGRMEEAASLIEQAEESGTSFFNIGVGESANLEVLRRLTPRRAPLRLTDVKDFSLFFKWLNVSLRSTSHSMAGERVPLPNALKTDPANPFGWGEI